MKTKNIQSGVLALLIAAGTSLSIHAQNHGPIEPPIPGGGTPPDAAEQVEREQAHPATDFDADEDGTITSVELMHAGEILLEEMQARFLAHFDSIPDGETAGDGIVTVEESLTAHEDRVIHRLESFLARYDLNEDGDVTADEIETVHGTKRHDRNRSRGNR